MFNADAGFFVLARRFFVLLLFISFHIYTPFSYFMSVVYWVWDGIILKSSWGSAP